MIIITEGMQQLWYPNNKQETDTSHEIEWMSGREVGTWQTTSTIGTAPFLFASMFLPNPFRLNLEKVTRDGYNIANPSDAPQTAMKALK
jgi:hypothetical protein